MFRELSVLEEVNDVRLQNLNPLWENREETPPTKLIRDALMSTRLQHF